MRNAKEDLDVAQLIERLPGVHEALGSALALYKLSVVAYECDPSTREAEAGGSGTRGLTIWPWLSWNSTGRPDCLQAHKALSASAS